MYAEWGFTTPEQALEWFLRFGRKVTILEPPEMVERIFDSMMWSRKRKKNALVRIYKT